MQVNTRIAALFFVVPFTVSVCIVVVESEVYSALFVISDRAADQGAFEEGADDR
jgi:hypothetical protein